MHLSSTGPFIHLRARARTHTQMLGKSQTVTGNKALGRHLWPGGSVSCRLSNYSRGQGDNTACSLPFHSSRPSTALTLNAEPTTQLTTMSSFNEPATKLQCMQVEKQQNFNFTAGNGSLGMAVRTFQPAESKVSLQLLCVLLGLPLAQPSGGHMWIRVKWTKIFLICIISDSK